MKYYIIAGEASGDLHGANLMKEIKLIDPNAQFRFWGGDLMFAQSSNIVKHYKQHSVMGFVPVLLNIRTILKNFRFAQHDILINKPDALILIDYPGFNLRIAKFAKTHRINVIYYISPTVWAWHKSRVFTIKKYVDKLFVILPFEKDFYKQYNYEVEFCGHPLLDAVQSANNQLTDKQTFIKKNNLKNNQPIVVLLAGSRKQEICTMLPEMLKATKHFKNVQFVIAAAPSISIDLYKKYCSDTNIPILYNQTYDILKHASAAIVTSGTASLETALFQVPQVVLYKMGTLSFAIAKMLVRNIKYISLANLIMNDCVFKELIQQNMNEKQIVSELNNLLYNEPYRNTMIQKYQQLKQNLGSIGASKRIAEKIYHYLTHQL